MKFLHLADLHLGRMLYGRSLIEDQQYFLEHVLLPAVDEHHPDAVLISGDIYDRPVAPTEAILLFSNLLESLAQRKIPVAAISGNHDGPERIAVGKGLLAKQGVHIVTNLEEAFSPILLGDAQVFALPFFDNAEMRAFLGDDTLRGAGACMRAAVEKMREVFDPQKKHILLAHCFAAGASTSDSESGIYVGGTGDVPVDVFDVFDYAALGHLHASQKAGEKARYAGSPLKYSVDEAHQKKCLTLVTLTDGGFEAELLPVVPLHDVKRVQGTFDELMNLPVDEDYAELVLTDEAPIYMPAEQLRKVFPNLLTVRNEWFTRLYTEETAAPVSRETGKDAIFRGFLRDVCGEEITEEDEALFADVLKTLEGGAL